MWPFSYLHPTPQTPLQLGDFHVIRVHDRIGRVFCLASIEEGIYHPHYRKKVSIGQVVGLTEEGAEMRVLGSIEPVEYPRDLIGRKITIPSHLMGDSWGELSPDDIVPGNWYAVVRPKGVDVVQVRAIRMREQIAIAELGCGPYNPLAETSGCRFLCRVDLSGLNCLTSPARCRGIHHAPAGR